MWPKVYRDYKIDESTVKESVEPSHGIIGCEMHDLNGWGNTFHVYKKRKRGFLYRLMTKFFRSKEPKI